ncbi:MAG TPA: DUF4397 domain-containing protein [Parasegetibacter sp.]
MKKANIISFRRLGVLRTLGIIFLASITFAACTKNNDDGPEIPAAGLMAFNLAPDRASIGIGLSGTALTPTPLTYTSFTGGYLNIYPGNRRIEAYDYNLTDYFTNTTFNFEENKYYSLFILGANGNYDNVVVHDDFEGLSGSNGMAYVRYINAIPDSGDTRVIVAAGGNNVVDQSEAYKYVSGFTPVTPGDITITANNTDNDIELERTISLAEGRAYTVLLVGESATTGPAQIRFIENGRLSD